MHISFIPYGDRKEVEMLLRDMEAQKHKLWMTKGRKNKFMWIQGQIRVLPLGIYEYVFPKENLETVLNTLETEIIPYKIKGIYLSMLRKMMKLKKIPKYKKEEKYLWLKQHVSIIPIGIREDKDMVDITHECKGWTHEAL